MPRLERYIPLAFLVAPVLGGCTRDDGPDGDDPPDCSSNQDCEGTAETPVCDTAAGVCGPLPLGHQIGHGDGSSTTAAIVPVFDPGGVFKEATDLEFHP